MKLRIEDPVEFWAKIALLGVVVLMAGYITWHENNPSAIYDLIYN